MPSNHRRPVKTVAKWLLTGIARSDSACRVFLPALREIERRRVALDSRWVESVIAETIPSLRVRHGPFQGLAYPAAEAVRSVLFPKLLGSYERELHGALEDILRNTPTAIVNIGCAEGFYAVGLATQLPDARVFAFDTDPLAGPACRRMAVHNGVGDRVVFDEYCTPRKLIEIPLGTHALVFSDCEGAERWIFTEEVARALRPHHCIIETHDFAQPGTGELIARRMRHTHDVVRITAIDDWTKVDEYRYDELASFSPRERWRLLREGRPKGMVWLVCSPRERPIQRARSRRSTPPAE